MWDLETIKQINSDAGVVASRNYALALNGKKKYEKIGEGKISSRAVTRNGNTGRRRHAARGQDSAL